MSEKDGKTAGSSWDPDEAELSPQEMLRRIESTLGFKAWARGAGSLARGGAAPETLKVAEVGCGTGTAALIFGLLGASVTLLDSNQKVLERARKIYGAFGCRADFIKADCLEPAGESLAGKFDVVLSGGLAEHFTGAYREKCFEFHQSLLKPGGLAMIGVPNRFSPFYQLVRRFRVLTGTWGPDIEVPFSNPELKSLAKGAGFSRYYVVGTIPLVKDFRVYSRGLISAVVDLLPDKLKGALRKWKAAAAEKEPLPPDPRSAAVKLCREAFEAAGKGPACDPAGACSDWLNSGLVLIGFK